VGGNQSGIFSPSFCTQVILVHLQDGKKVKDVNYPSRLDNRLIRVKESLDLDENREEVEEILHFKRQKNTRDGGLEIMKKGNS